MRLLEGQQAVSVIFILLAASGDLRRQAAGKVVDQRIELVEDSDDASLLFEGRNGDDNSLKICHRNTYNC